MPKQEDWTFTIRGRTVTVRVCLDGTGLAKRGRLTSFHVLHGPGQVGLSVPVESQQDAETKTEALLSRLLGSGWY